jgi:hypothetical protein
MASRVAPHPRKSGDPVVGMPRNEKHASDLVPVLAKSGEAGRDQNIK